MEPIELEILRVRLQRVVKENRVYRSLYHNHMALLAGGNAHPTESLPESLRRKEEAETEALRRKEESGAEKWQLQLHHLQEQLQEREESLVVSRERVRYLQYAVNQLREAMSIHFIQPPILTEYDYYRLLQGSELCGLRSLFGKRFVMADDERLSSFLSDQTDLPLSLIPSLLRNYVASVYPLGSSRTQKSVCKRRWMLKSPTNPSRAQAQSVFSFSEFCMDEVFSMCVDSLPAVLQLDVFEDFWNSFLCGYSPKQRLYRLVGDGGVVTYTHLKRMVCDYLLTHPKTVRKIHEMNWYGEGDDESICALSQHGRDGFSWAELSTSPCCYCSMYVITVAAAILFDLTGYLSPMVYFRQLNDSRLVSTCRASYLAVHSSSSGSKAGFARVPLRAHLFATDLHALRVDETKCS